MCCVLPPLQSRGPDTRSVFPQLPLAEERLIFAIPSHGDVGKRGKEETCPSLFWIIIRFCYQHSQLIKFPYLYQAEFEICWLRTSSNSVRILLTFDYFMLIHCSPHFRKSVHLLLRHSETWGYSDNCEFLPQIKTSLTFPLTYPFFCSSTIRDDSSLFAETRIRYRANPYEIVGTQSESERGCSPGSSLDLKSW